MSNRTKGFRNEEQLHLFDEISRGCQGLIV